MHNFITESKKNFSLARFAIYRMLSEGGKLFKSTVACDSARINTISIFPFLCAFLVFAALLFFQKGHNMNATRVFFFIMINIYPPSPSRLSAKRNKENSSHTSALSSENRKKGEAANG
jgi:hypothetical protein